MAKKFSSGFLHEKIVFFSLFFLIIVLSLDCLFQNHLISGYGLIVLTIILISFTTCVTCHGIKWVINSNKPLQFCISEESQNEKWLKLLLKFENKIFWRVFNKCSQSLESFKYPTNFSEQIRLLIKDIEKHFVKTWYSEISPNPSFLFDSHLVLEEIFFKIFKKLKTISCKNVIISILILYINHLQEYKRAKKKFTRQNVKSEAKIELLDFCRYLHPGSQSEQMINYYLKKMTKSLLKEFSSHDFSETLECKILGAIIGRKVFKKLLSTIEDPDWVNLKLIYLLNKEKHNEMLGNKVYVVKEKTVVQEEVEYQYKKPIVVKKYLSANLFNNGGNFFARNEFISENGAKVEEKEVKSPKKELLSLPLYNGNTTREETKGNISTVLSGLISSTAGPLLPDNISVRYKAFNKMWHSPVCEVKKEISESFAESFHKIFDCAKDKRAIFRSKSTESLAEMPGSLKSKDVSLGEDLCESILYRSTDTANGIHKVKKLTKTRSFDSDSLMMESTVDDGTTTEEKTLDDVETKRDVSPVYEEPEDFATTIAKLRSLLQQREPNSISLSDKSNLSLDSQSTDKSDFSNKSMEGNSFDSHIACDVPTDGRLFINVNIPKGDLITDSSGSSFVLYTIQYDGIYVLKDEHNSSSEPELVLHTTAVRRKFQEFLHLQAKLEENNNYKPFMKGIGGPSKWLQLNASGKSDDHMSVSRRAMLESFLRQLCSKPELSNSQDLQEFLEYGHSGSDAFVKKNSNFSLQRIDKLLAHKVTGVFNSIKTALPSFDFDSAALVATNDTVKSLQEQKLLQNFLNFGHKNDLFELNFTFVVKDSTKDSLTDDIRHFISGKTDNIEDAVDVLDSNEWLSEQRECKFISAEEKCVWHGYKDVVVDELETLDSWSPVYSLLLDIICELLQDSDCWAVKEPVIRLLKVASGHWEQKFQEEITRLDWDRIFANLIRLLRGAVFQPEKNENHDLDGLETSKVLKEVILSSFPDWITAFVTPEGLQSAVSLFVDSFQDFRLNRNFLLKIMDIFLIHLLPCQHLIMDSKR